MSVGEEIPLCQEGVTSTISARETIEVSVLKVFASSKVSSESYHDAADYPGKNLRYVIACPGASNLTALDKAAINVLNAALGWLVILLEGNSLLLV
ncbi:hypothetical protein Tco_1138726 [Tanacetum coccineum]